VLAADHGRPACRSTLLRIMVCAAATTFASTLASAQPPQTVICCSPDGEAVVAIVDGEPIRMRDLDAYSRKQDAQKLFQLNQQLYNVQAQVLDDLLGERLLEQEAIRQNMTVEQLVKTIPGINVAPPSEADVLREYQRLTANRPLGAPSLDSMKPLITVYLEGQRSNVARKAFIQTLIERAQKTPTGIAWYLDVPREHIETGDADPTLGSGTIEIVEFGDFQCEYCKALAPVLRQLVDEFPNKVRLVWKDAPGPGHEYAHSAAEAARCARAQNKFWEFSEILFSHTDALGSADLAKYAAKVNLDMELYSQCVDHGEHRPAVAAASQLAQRYGVRMTPTVFINGRIVAGAATLDVYRRVVSQELLSNSGKRVEVPR